MGRNDDPKPNSPAARASQAMAMERVLGRALLQVRDMEYSMEQLVHARRGAPWLPGQVVTTKEAVEASPDDERYWPKITIAFIDYFEAEDKWVVRTRLPNGDPGRRFNEEEVILVD